MTWRPILEGRSAASARAAIEDVLVATEKTRWTDYQRTAYGLIEGETCSLLLSAYAARAGLMSVDRVSELADGLAELGPRNITSLFLWHGITGIAWALDHAATVCDQPTNLDTFSELDDGLFELLEIEGSAFELLRGAAGLMVYAEPRLEAVRGRDLIAAIVRALATSAKADGDRVWWHTAPSQLPAEARLRHPDGYVATGLAHGIAGPIVALGVACRLGIEIDLARPLLARAIEWLWAQETPDSSDRQRFPTYLGDARGAVRGGWCYGDIGLASAVDLAARDANMPEHRARAQLLAREVAQRPLARAHLDNPMFCHGTSGVAHMFNRWFQRTNDPVFRDAAIAAFEQTLAMREPGVGAGGFSSVSYDTEGPHKVTQYGLLDGSAGVALALLAAITDIEPGWDRPFMLG